MVIYWADFDIHGNRIEESQFERVIKSNKEEI